MKGVCLTITLSILNLCSGQSLSGLWKGNCEHSIFVLNPIESVLEIEVYNDSMITGIVHNYYKKERFDHTKISGIINWIDSTVSISEIEEISHNVNTKIFETCLGNMNLKLSKNYNGYTLQGKWSDQNRKLFHCPTLSIWFEKPISDSSRKINDQLFSSRKTNIQRVIELDTDETDSIKLTLYDNAEIDDDTASVYFDDSLIVKSKRLSQSPIEVIISIDEKRKVHHIRLIAENLGTISPNTALLIITTRKNRYTLTLSSDYSKNASVELFLKE